MGIIGKVYANSMLVLINSRMLLGSEDMSKIVSGLVFGPVPAGGRESAIQSNGGGLAVDIEAREGPSRSAEPHQV